MLAIFVLIVFAVLLALGLVREEQSEMTAAAYLVGAVSSAVAGFIGMRIAVKSNMRTAAAAQTSLNQALRVAFSSGGVMGITVVGIGILGAVILWMVFEDPNIVAGFSFGASSIALFARVGGGIYTKAADVGGDLAGKVEAGIPEDDPRNAAVIADNVGDNVGDVAGMGADLFESYVGSIIASLALAATGTAFLIGSDPALVDIAADSALAVLPFLIAAVGIAASIIGTFLVRTGETTNIGSLLWSLRKGIFAAGVLALAGSFGAIYWLIETQNGYGLESVLQLWGAVAVGLVAGVIIGVSTEYYTSYEYKPTRGIAARSVTGPATLIISGFATGMLSTVIPLIVIAAAVLGAHELAGLYGIAIAAVGMLSTLGITLATDAYGPVADNAGAIAEQAHLDPEVRERTDALDSLGNTTAATGKGFAIGSAVLTSLALMAAYANVVGLEAIDLLDVSTLAGLLIGALMPFLFSALTMEAVGKAAQDMVEEVRRQFNEIPGLREGREGVRAEYARCVDISTKGALREMIIPGCSRSSSRLASALSRSWEPRPWAAFLSAPSRRDRCWRSRWRTPAARGTTRRSTSRPAPTAARAPMSTPPPSWATRWATHSRTPPGRRSTSSSSSCPSLRWCSGRPSPRSRSAWSLSESPGRLLYAGGQAHECEHGGKDGPGHRRQEGARYGRDPAASATPSPWNWPRKASTWPSAPGMAPQRQPSLRRSARLPARRSWGSKPTLASLTT